MAFEGKVIVNCVREEMRDLMLWDESGKSHIFYSTKNFLSIPQYVNKTLTWYEYDLTGVSSVHQWEGRGNEDHTGWRGCSCCQFPWE